MLNKAPIIVFCDDVYERHEWFILHVVPEVVNRSMELLGVKPRLIHCSGYEILHIQESQFATHKFHDVVRNEDIDILVTDNNFIREGRDTGLRIVNEAKLHRSQTESFIITAETPEEMQQVIELANRGYIGDWVNLPGSKPTRENAIRLATTLKQALIRISQIRAMMTVAPLYKVLHNDKTVNHTSTIEITTIGTAKIKTLTFSLKQMAAYYFDALVELAPYYQMSEKIFGKVSKIIGIKPNKLCRDRIIELHESFGITLRYKTTKLRGGLCTPENSVICQYAKTYGAYEPKVDEDGFTCSQKGFCAKRLMEIPNWGNAITYDTDPKNAVKKHIKEIRDAINEADRCIANELGLTAILLPCNHNQGKPREYAGYCGECFISNIPRLGYAMAVNKSNE